MDPIEIAKSVIGKENVSGKFDVEFKGIKLQLSIRISTYRGTILIVLEDSLRMLIEFSKESNEWKLLVDSIQVDESESIKYDPPQVKQTSRGKGIATFLLELAEFIAKYFGIRICYLADVAKVKCGDDTTYLYLIYTLKNGCTWYESKGYKPVFPNNFYDEEERYKSSRHNLLTYTTSEFMKWFGTLKGQNKAKKILKTRRISRFILFREFLLHLYENHPNEYKELLNWSLVIEEPTLESFRRAWCSVKEYQKNI